MAQFTVVIYTPQELNHSSNIQTGLFELEKSGLINLKIEISTKKLLGRYITNENGGLKESNQPHPKTSFYKLIDNNNGKEIRFATDLYDFANHFSKEALESCDFVFKRSYESRHVSSLPEKYQEKIKKLGFTFGVHSAVHSGSSKFFWGLLLSNLKIRVKMDGFFFKRIKDTFKSELNHWKFINTTRKISRFENYNKAIENSVFFQTRCFLREDQPDVLAIHQQRYRIIKLLRKHFPNHFLGGFVPSKISKDKYSDALSNVPSEPEKYLNALKNAKIVIYTRGLANSPAWKMPEYLSQAKVIIAERLTTELPEPLIDGKHLLYFNSDDELIEKIKLVLQDTALASQLSSNARNYFEKYIHPVQNTKRIIEIMLNKSLEHS